jgi:radical SAM superfamily enzyme YgiQ (UPF0313 family)
MKNNVYLFQVQYAIEISDKTNYYLPYSIGCIVAYAKQFEDIRDNWDFGELFFKREDPIEVVKRLDNPKVCAFSSYVWNEVISQEIAKEVRKQYPDCIIVWGGPQVGPEDYDLDWCDIVIKAEGERNFVNILRDIDAGKELPQTYTSDRIDKLDECPSPYLEGVFDDIIASHPEAVFAMTLETNRGCPFQCTFCDWGSLTYAKIKKFDLDKVVGELDWATQNPIGYLWVADANFGVFKARDIAIANLIKYACDHPDSGIDAVNIQYYKNSTEISFEIARILGKYNRGMTLSVQSMTEEVLVAIKRDNLEINDLTKLLKQAREYNVLAYSEVILPLPEESLDSFKTSITQLLECGQHNAIEMWMGQLLKNSELGSKEHIEKYGIGWVEAYDYNYYHNPLDWNEKREKINLINKTNTMSTPEVTKAYMYGWMILQLHTQGYTQLVSRYLRGVHNIPYRQFYDRLYELLQIDDKLKVIFNFVEQFEKAYITTGELPDPKDIDPTIEVPKLGGHFTAQMSMDMIYKNRQSIYALAEQIVNELGFTNESIIKMNRDHLYEDNKEYQSTYHSDYDIEEWTPGQFEYELEPCISKKWVTQSIVSAKVNSANKQIEAIQQRRRGLKNYYKKLDN